MNNPNHDDRTTGGWRLDEGINGLDLDEPDIVEQAPPLWKDLMLASIVALLLWIAAVAMFR